MLVCACIPNLKLTRQFMIDNPRSPLFSVGLPGCGEIVTQLNLVDVVYRVTRKIEPKEIRSRLLADTFGDSLVASFDEILGAKTTAELEAGGGSEALGRRFLLRYNDAMEGTPGGRTVLSVRCARIAVVSSAKALGQPAGENAALRKSDASVVIDFETFLDLGGDHVAFYHLSESEEGDRGNREDVPGGRLVEIAYANIRIIEVSLVRAHC